MAGPWEDHPAVAVQSHLGFTSGVLRRLLLAGRWSRWRCHPSRCWLSPEEELTLPSILNIRSRRSHRAWAAGPAPEIRGGTTQRRKELWALQTITSQLRLSVHSPQWCLGPNNLVFTCRVLCSAQEEEPETKAFPFDITIPAEDEAFLVNESK